MVKTLEPVEILDAYIHIDNGGYSFKMTVEDNGDCAAGLGNGYGGGLSISNSFLGYSTNEMNFCLINSKHLRMLAEKFLAAAIKLDELNLKKKD